MNLAAADLASRRSVAAYVAAPVFLAVISDRVIAVIRQHVLPMDTESAWVPLGRVAGAVLRQGAVVALYLLRAVLAPSGTLRGLRQMVLDAAPVPGMTGVRQVCGEQSSCSDDQDGNQGAAQPVIEFPTKKAAFLPATALTPSTATGQLPGESRSSSHRSRPCSRAPGAPTSPKSYAGSRRWHSPAALLRRMMTSPQAEPGAQALGESLAALAVQVAALRGQVAQVNQRLDRTGLRGELDLASRFEELAQTVADALDAAAPRGPAASCWIGLDRQAYDTQLAELRKWADTMLRRHYGGYELRDCWPRHIHAIWELSTMAATWHHAYGGQRPDLGRALEFYDRWLPGTMRRIAAITRTCVPQCVMLRRSW